MGAPYVVVDTILILANYQVFWGKYRFLFGYRERVGPDFQMDIFCMTNIDQVCTGCRPCLKGWRDWWHYDNLSHIWWMFGIIDMYQLGHGDSRRGYLYHNQAHWTGWWENRHSLHICIKIQFNFCLMLNCGTVFVKNPF